MKKKSIPTFIGLFVLVAGLAAALFLIRGQQIFRLGAAGTLAPQDVRITNISDNTFTVSWTTGKETVSFVKWGTSAGSLTKKTDATSKNPAFVHSASLSPLTPGTTYFFKINSAGSDFDNNGSPWQISTGPSLAPPAKTTNATGTVLAATGTPVSGALVYLTAGSASALSTTTSPKGSWIIPISNARSTDLSSFVSIDEAKTLLEITVNAGPNGIATAQVYPQSAKPVPPIILGDTNDFKNAPISKTADLPEADLLVPPETEPESGFNVEGAGDNLSAQTVTLESVEQGEVITSTAPEFFGEGPVGEVLTITVESEAQTATVTIPSSGDWKWSPPTDLPEGTHKIKISWRDEGGILRTIERTFVVQAAEGPAFESTPSGTASASATPKATATATPKATATATASATPTPTLDPEVSDSGVLTPTIALSIMGIGLLAFAVFLFKEANA